MFERIIALDGSERAERAIPLVANVEISEKDLADAESYLAALKTAYAKRKEKPPVATTRDDLPRTAQPAYQVQQASGPPPRWIRALVRLILESSCPR